MTALVFFGLYTKAKGSGRMTMRHTTRGRFGVGIAVGAVLTLAVASQASAAPPFLAFLITQLTGAQEVPSVLTGNSGSGVVFLDITNSRLHWMINHGGLDYPGCGQPSGCASAAHFHGPAFPGSEAPILVDIGAISGLGQPMVGSALVSASQAREILDGKWYVNVHTNRFPEGEIRGQVVGGPEVPVFISPPFGIFGQTQGLNIAVLVQPPSGASITGGAVTFDGRDVTTAFLGCLRVTTLMGGGVLLLCDVPGLPVGEHVFTIRVDLSDGTSAGSMAVWTVVANTAP